MTKPKTPATPLPAAVATLGLTVLAAEPVQRVLADEGLDVPKHPPQEPDVIGITRYSENAPTPASTDYMARFADAVVQ